MLSRLFVITILFSFYLGNCQDSVNDYKYVLIPQEYEFLKETDQYQLNSLSKFLFEKYGFEAFIKGSDLPEDLSKDRCKAMTAAVEKKSGLFTTKLIIILKNCDGDIIFTSEEGTSREKEFKVAYHEALRNAFKSVEQINYKYVGDSDKTKSVTAPQNMEIGENSPLQKAEQVQDNTQVGKPDSAADVMDLKQAGSSPDSLEMTYLLGSKQFVLKKALYGFDLLTIRNNQKTMLGKIYKAKKENLYLIDAAAYSGLGYFDEYNNFIIERINPASDQLIIDTLARQ